MNTKESGGPAFPVPVLSGDADFNGMTLRQYAAITLRVPDSGEDWLDEMIKRSIRQTYIELAIPETFTALREDKDIGTPGETVGDFLVKRVKKFADHMIGKVDT